MILAGALFGVAPILPLSRQRRGPSAGLAPGVRDSLGLIPRGQAVRLRYPASVS
jgi:hypothetical protein